MILHYVNTRIRISAFRSLNQSNIKKSLVHTSQAICGEQESKGNGNKEEKPIETNDKQQTSKASIERRKQMLRAKFAKVDFISLDQKTPMSKSTQEKLKPEIDYQLLVKNKGNSEIEDKKLQDRSEIKGTKQIKIEMDTRLEETKKLKERFEKPYASIQLEETTALKLASLINKENKEETAKMLMEPFKNINKKEIQREIKEKNNENQNDSELRF